MLEITRFFFLKYCIVPINTYRLDVEPFLPTSDFCERISLFGFRNFFTLISYTNVLKATLYSFPTLVPSKQQHVLGVFSGSESNSKKFWEKSDKHQIFAHLIWWCYRDRLFMLLCQQRPVDFKSHSCAKEPNFVFQAQWRAVAHILFMMGLETKAPCYQEGQCIDWAPFNCILCMLNIRMTTKTQEKYNTGA